MYVSNLLCCLVCVFLAVFSYFVSDKFHIRLVSGSIRIYSFIGIQHSIALIHSLIPIPCPFPLIPPEKTLSYNLRTHCTLHQPSASSPNTNSNKTFINQVIIGLNAPQFSSFEWPYNFTYIFAYLPYLPLEQLLNLHLFTPFVCCIHI